MTERDPGQRVTKAIECYFQGRSLEAGQIVLLDGESGQRKSTLCRWMHDRFGCPAIHVDDYLPDSPEAASGATFLSRLDFARLTADVCAIQAQGAAWVMDGLFGKDLADALEIARVHHWIVIHGNRAHGPFEAAYATTRRPQVFKHPLSCQLSDYFRRRDPRANADLLIHLFPEGDEH